MSEQGTLPGISAETSVELPPVNLTGLIAARSEMPRGEYLISKAIKSTGILIWKKEDALGPYRRVARNVDPACAQGLVAAHNAIGALIEIAVAGIAWAESDGRQSDALIRALGKVTIDPGRADARLEIDPGRADAQLEIDPGLVDAQLGEIDQTK